MGTSLPSVRAVCRKAVLLRIDLGEGGSGGRGMGGTICLTGVGESRGRGTGVVLGESGGVG